MAKPTPITSLPPSPDDDRRGRMLRYSVAMTIRVICIFACLVTPGWWMIIPAIGAIVLPYIAVVVANISVRPSGTMESPDPRSVVRYQDGENAS